MSQPAYHLILLAEYVKAPYIHGSSSSLTRVETQGGRGCTARASVCSCRVAMRVRLGGSLSFSACGSRVVLLSLFIRVAVIHLTCVPDGGGEGGDLFPSLCC